MSSLSESRTHTSVLIHFVQFCGSGTGQFPTKGSRFENTLLKDRCNSFCPPPVYRVSIFVCPNLLLSLSDHQIPTFSASYQRRTGNLSHLQKKWLDLGVSCLPATNFCVFWRKSDRRKFVALSPKCTNMCTSRADKLTLTFVRSCFSPKIAFCPNIGRFLPCTVRKAVFVPWQERSRCLKHRWTCRVAVLAAAFVHGDWYEIHKRCVQGCKREQQVDIAIGDIRLATRSNSSQGMRLSSVCKYYFALYTGRISANDVLAVGWEVPRECRNYGILRGDPVSVRLGEWTESPGPAATSRESGAVKWTMTAVIRGEGAADHTRRVRLLRIDLAVVCSALLLNKSIYLLPRCLNVSKCAHCVHSLQMRNKNLPLY